MLRGKFIAVNNDVRKELRSQTNNPTFCFKALEIVVMAELKEGNQKG